MAPPTAGGPKSRASTSRPQSPANRGRRSRPRAPRRRSSRRRRGYNPRLPGGSAPISTDRPQLSAAGDAIRAVARLLASGAGGQGVLERALAGELRAFAGARSALLLRVDERAGLATCVAADPGGSAGD